jgi:hypothetical protein
MANSRESRLEKLAIVVMLKREWRRLDYKGRSNNLLHTGDTSNRQKQTLA